MQRALWRRNDQGCGLGKGEGRQLKVNIREEISSGLQRIDSNVDGSKERLESLKVRDRIGYVRSFIVLWGSWRSSAVHVLQT
jgi:hypothetical protein